MTAAPGRSCPAGYGYPPSVFGDTAAWDASFRRWWPAGSDAALSYGRRILEGPPFTIGDALGRSAPALCTKLAA